MIAFKVLSRPFGFAALLAVPLVLSACGSVREAVGIDADSPDEYQVVVRAPLSMPADYGLRAPRPGASGPQEAKVRDRTRQIVLDSQGKAAKKMAPKPIAGVSKVEMALLNRLGAESVDPNIRQVVERETTVIEAGQRSAVETILFWRPKTPGGTALDATAERRRLQENAALGRTAIEGQSPQIERKKASSLLERLF
jgi:hypothetical protein